ncbi:MAG: isoprenylcysteine carboxylmethyltransferase family protein [Parvularculaceae bacterium]
MGLIALAYGVACYLFFFAVFLYFVVFVGGDALGAATAGVAPFLGSVKTVDAVAARNVFAPPAVQNIALLLLFGVSHSVMARASFKRAWTKIIPKPCERSTYVLTASLVLVAIFHLWRPMPAVIWSATGLWSALLLIGYFIGVATVLLSTFMINHFDLFGLKQVWARFKNTEFKHDNFRTPFLYAVVRHPLYLGFLILVWTTPMMTAGHLLFAAGMSIYIFVAIGYEERDLIAHFGEEYHRYMQRVPSILPFGGGKN